MGTARMKWDEEIDEEGKEAWVWQEAKQARKKAWRPITLQSKYNNKQNMVVFYKIWKKYNEIQLTKKKLLK